MFATTTTTRTTVLALCWVSLLSSSQAWMLPQRHIAIIPAGTTTTTTTQLRSTTSPSLSNLKSKDVQIDELKADIARMKQEALERLELLNRDMHQAEVSFREQKEWEQQEQQQQQHEVVSMETKRLASSPSNNNNENEKEATLAAIPSPSLYEDDEASQTDQLVQARKERENLHFLETVTNEKPIEATTATSSSSTAMSATPLSVHSKSLRLLEDTRWRLMMNIGREQGTWMSKTWGASGDRLRLHLELEFTKDQLYEREDFLNGISGAQVLKVIHAEGDLAPCLQHGGRKIRIKQAGGWRVAPKEGPMGTSVLRFYFDLEEEARHTGSDVYCPAGRVYCTCGYFNMEGRHKQGVVSEKDLLKDEMRLIEATYETLATENELDTDLVSWKKLQRTKRLMDLRSQATTSNQKMHDAHVREPDRSLLRLSRDQSVGLTREGGVCCKVHKGLAIEYHILGKFEIASMENREHSDYKELLP